MIPSWHLVDRVADAAAGCYDGGGGGNIAAATEAEIALFAATYVSPVQPAGSSLCTLCGTVIRNGARIRGGRLGGRGPSLNFFCFWVLVGMILVAL